MDKWICNKCGFITFDKPENKNTTCLDCKNGRYRLIRMCKCGETFHPDRYSQKYCSKKCGYKYRKTGGKKGKKYPHTQRAAERRCLVCNNTFRAVNDYKERKQKYCSTECWSVRATVTKQCLYCNNEFETQESTGKVYCDSDCRDLHYRERFKGENSHLWEGGKTARSKRRRTSAKYKEWRMSVFKRDNFTCQYCGSTEDLEGHHIKEQSNYPELIFDVDNGLTLCHECHKKTDNYGYKAKMNGA